MPETGDGEKAEGKEGSEEYQLKRGDLVELNTDGNTGIVLGYVDIDLICVKEFIDKGGREITVVDVGDAELLAKAEEIVESLLPKQLDIKPTNPS